MSSTKQVISGNESAVISKKVKFQLHSIEELMNLPPAEWLIEGVMERGALVILYGPPAEGKSFTALDWALSVATGRAWVGRSVKKGPVIYVVAEGGVGIRKRVKAWQKVTGEKQIDQAFVVLEAVQLGDKTDIETLLSRIKGENLSPALIVLDTFARCFVGGDENLAKDVGHWVYGCGRIQAETGAAMLVVHHSGKNKKAQDIERGSSALRGAADTMICQRMNAIRQVTIKNTKQKDQEEFKPIQLRLEQVSLSGNDDTSCVLKALGGSVSLPPAGGGTVTLPSSEAEALKTLALEPGQAMTSAQWQKAIGASRQNLVANKTFHNWRKGLLDKGFVEAVPGQSHHYRLTADGASAIGVPLACHEMGPPSAMPATPPKGVADGTGDGIAVAAVAVGDDAEDEVA